MPGRIHAEGISAETPEPTSDPPWRNAGRGRRNGIWPGCREPRVDARAFAEEVTPQKEHGQLDRAERSTSPIPHRMGQGDQIPRIAFVDTWTCCFLIRPECLVVETVRSQD